jgi:hypothetical protein
MCFSSQFQLHRFYPFARAYFNHAAAARMRNTPVNTAKAG